MNEEGYLGVGTRMRSLLRSPFLNPKHRLVEEELFSLLTRSSSPHHINQIQARLFALGLHRNNFIGAKLVAACSAVRAIDHALLLFRHVESHKICLWNALIRALPADNLPPQTLYIYCCMKHSQVVPNNSTFLFVLKACSMLSALSHGQALHSEIIRLGLGTDLFICNAVLDMYSKCGCFSDARKVFDGMPQRDVVAWNSMVKAFLRREDIGGARALFDDMPERSTVSWNTMIAGYAQNGRPSEALKLFRQMQSERVRPNEVTLLSVLSACAQLGALEVGKWVHRYIERNNIRMGIFVRNALIDMYAKGGSLYHARQVFDEMPERSVVSWNSMISGLAVHGLGEDAVSLFARMEREGIEPNDLTFIGVLCACTHAGLVKDGRRYFASMTEKHGIVPKVEHYGCMVDLLGRAGCIVEAHELVKNMPISPDAGIWGALLGACRMHGYTELAEHAVVHLLELEPWNPGNYVLLSNIYAAKGQWEAVEKVREKMRGMMVQKTPGSSSIEIESSIHEFIIGDRSHPHSEEIYKKLEELDVQLKRVGYTPDVDLVLHDICEEEKESTLRVHSEKLAIAFGLISTAPGTPIRIVKNLRVCRDCHTATRLISKIVGREITLRDRIRFHHFKDGLCSCKDYW